jgi:uncharacterized protein (DUF1697 family)
MAGAWRAGKHPYVAMVRAINVGGHGVVTMADLRARFEAAGAADVSTYIQSGNVLFTSKEKDPAAVGAALEKKLVVAFGAPVRLFVRTPAELAAAAAANPFEPARLEREQHCHLLFLSAAPDAARRRALAAIDAPDYRLHLGERVLYFAYSRTLEGRRRAIDFEKILGVAATARTWKVVAKLIELAADLPT